MTAKKALSQLPCVYQSIGRIIEIIRRTKDGSPYNVKLWKKYDKLNKEGAELSCVIRKSI